MNKNDAYELKDNLVASLGADRVLNDLIEALSTDVAMEHLGWIAKQYDLDELLLDKNK